MVNVLFQTKCVGCGKMIEPYQNKLALVEKHYEGNRAIKQRIVGHYCWECYKKDFEETVV